MLTTNEVAERLNVTMRRVRALIEAGRLPSQQFGRDHLIKESDLKLVADRKSGRPPKAKAETVSKVSKKKGRIVQARKTKPLCTESAEISEWTESPIIPR